MQTHDVDPIPICSPTIIQLFLFSVLYNELFEDANERAFNQARVKRRWHEHFFLLCLSYLKKDDHHHSYVSSEEKRTSDGWMNGSMAFFRLSLVSFFFQCLCLYVRLLLLLDAAKLMRSRTYMRREVKSKKQKNKIKKIVHTVGGWIEIMTWVNLPMPTGRRTSNHT